MAEEKKTGIKIKLLEDWNLAGIKQYKKDEIISVEPEIYESIKLVVDHEVVK